MMAQKFFLYSYFSLWTLKAFQVSAYHLLSKMPGRKNKLCNELLVECLSTPSPKKVKSANMQIENHPEGKQGSN